MVNILLKPDVFATAPFNPFSDQHGLMIDPETVVTETEQGEPFVHVATQPITSMALPDGFSNTCDMRGRGIIFIPKKGVLETIHKALANPKYHPQVLTGVDKAELVDTYPSNAQNEILRMMTWQESPRMQYLTWFIAHEFPNGRSYSQMGIDDFATRLPALTERSEKSTEAIKNFFGLIQVVEIENGTVIVMETVFHAAVPTSSCERAAGNDLLAKVFGGDRPVKQGMEQRLINLYKVAMGEIILS